MRKPKSNLELTLERLKSQGKVQSISYAEMQKICGPINEVMEEARIDFRYKEAKSWETASKIYFTA